MHKDVLMAVASTHGQLKQIREMQKLNHYKNLAEDEKGKQGFVSVQTTLKVLEKIRNRTGIILAVDGKEVVGYEIPLPLDIAKKIPILEPFVARFASLKFEGQVLTDYELVIAGQICLKPEYKGQGLAEQMHGTFRRLLKNKFDVLVTEVSSQNPRSLHVATNKLGFQVIEQYEAEGNQWHVLAQKL